MRDEYAVALRLIAQMLAFDHFVVAVIVDFRGVQRPIKAVRELGSERRETVRSLSGVGVGYLRGAGLSTRGPGWTDRWCICCSARSMAE